MKKFSFLSILSILFFISCDESTETVQDNVSTSKDSTSTKKIETKKPRKISPIDSLTAILRKNPNDAEAFVARAEKYLAIKSYQAAAGDIFNAMQIDSNSAQVRNLKGQLNYLQNKTRLARDEWEKCTKMDSENIDCRLRLSELYYAVQTYERALVLVNEVIALDPNNFGAFYFKGLLIRDSKQDTTLALQYFQKSIDLNPNFINGLDMMGVTLATAGDTFAKFYYARVLSIDPNRDDIYYKLGVFYMEQDEINKALENYTKALSLNPRNSDAHYSLGFIHIQLKQYSDAKKYFSRAIDTRSQNYKAYYGRGFCFEQLGDVINAKRDYQKSLDASPVFKPAKEALDRVQLSIDAASVKQ